MRRLLLAAGAVALLCAAAPAAAAPAPPVPGGPPGVRYVALLADAAARLRSGDRPGARTDLAAAGALSPSAHAVVDAARADLAAGLDDSAAARLEAAVRWLSLPAGAEPSDGGTARSRLQDVYGRPVFSTLDRPRDESLLDRLGGWLQDLAGRLAGASDNRLLIAGAALLAALLAWLLARQVRGASATRRRAAPADTLAGLADPDAEWGLALAAAAAGEHREAVRRAFRSALLTVALSTATAIDPSWTTRELLARLRAPAEVLAALAPAAAAFERAWYSGEATTSAEWEVARDRCAQVRRLCGARASR